MDPVLYSFEAQQSALTSAFWLALLIGIASLAGMLFLLRKPATKENRTRNLLMAMLFFFAFLIASSTAFFSSWTRVKLGPVVLYANRIQLSNEKVPFEKIKNAYIHEDKQTSPLNAKLVKRSTRLLVIEELNNKTHVLSEENYDVNNILGNLKETISNWKKQN